MLTGRPALSVPGTLHAVHGRPMRLSGPGSDAGAPGMPTVTPRATSSSDGWRPGRRAVGRPAASRADV